MKNSARGDSSRSELKAVEEACREASRTVEPCGLSGREKKSLFAKMSSCKYLISLRQILRF